MKIESIHMQPNNPTDEERHIMLKIALEQANHIEDFDNIVELLKPPNDITTVANSTVGNGIKIGIIGGGLAGLSSTFELRKLGFDITIFEMQQTRVGGRVYTHYFDKDKRFYGELGAMRIPVVHETTWHYINLFGLKTRPFIQTNENAFIYVRNKRARNDSEGKSVMEKIYPEFNLTAKERNTSWGELIGNALDTYLLKMDPDIRKEILQIKKKYSLPVKYRGSLSIRKVLEKMGLSEGAVELISCVAPLLGYFYSNSYSENMQEEYSVDSAFRYEIVGGMVNLPLSFYHSLMSKNPKEYSNIPKKDLKKVAWENGKTVTSIQKSDKDNKVTLEYKDERTGKQSVQTFDFVICAIPFSSLSSVEVKPMFSPEKMQAIKEVNYASAQKTILMCSERFWERGDAKEKIFGGGSYTDLPIGSIWYPSHHGNSQSLRKESKNISIINRKYNSYYDAGVLLASYNINQNAVRLANLESKTRLEQIKRQVEEVHGLRASYLDSIVKDFKTINWTIEKGFYGAFCYFMPEQQSLFQYAIVKPEYDNRVYFAGEHASTTHAWMQGALNSGMKAASAIVEYCKKMWTQ